MFKYRKTGGLIHGTIEAGLFYTPFLIFSILLLLSFFTHPAAEDLAIYHYNHVLGLKGNMMEFYHTRCSRYFSFPVTFILFDGDFVSGHYYVVALFLLIAFWGVLFLFVRTLTRQLFGSGASGQFFETAISGKWCAWLSMTLLLAISSVVFEMPSIFYWITGSMTYLFSFLLVGLLLTILLASAGDGKMSGPASILCLLLAVCIPGGNEVDLYFLVVTLVWWQMVNARLSIKRNRFIPLLLAVVFLCCLFLIVPGGTARRAGGFKLNFPLGKGILVSAGYTGRVFFQALSAPMVWLCLCLAYLAGIFTKENIRMTLAGRRAFRPGMILLLVISAVSFFYFLVYVFSAELLPPRTNNLLLFYVFFYLLICCYALGIRSKSSVLFMRAFYKHQGARLLVVLVFVTSPLLYNGVQNIFTGLVYDKVMRQREKEIGIAALRGSHRVVLNSYEADFDSIAGTVLPLFLRVQLARKVNRYPLLIHYQDPAADSGLYIHYFAEIHHIDTINYGGVDYRRIGLIEKSN